MDCHMEVRYLCHNKFNTLQVLQLLNFEELSSMKTKSKESNRANGVSYIPPPNAFWGPLARPKAKINQDDSVENDEDETRIDDSAVHPTQ